MPKLNWNKFEELPGSADENFEMLCRSLISRTFGRYGTFAALANQPGVEFHLKLEQDCSLGKSNSWLGWQCRWYSLPSGQPIGATRRKKIIDAIRKTERVIPGLTHWILWTKYPLAKTDQEWFYAIETNFKLTPWSRIEVEEYLIGEAEILRSSYFGELVLTPDSLNKLHRISTESIRHRWLPSVHQILDAERILRRMLGEFNSWDNLMKLIRQLSTNLNSVESNLIDLPEVLVKSAKEFISLSNSMLNKLRDVSEFIRIFNFDLLRSCLDNRIKSLDKSILILPRIMRKCHLQCSLWITNGVSDLNMAIDLLNEVEDCFETQIIAVLADAGYGKTQLAAQLTSSSPERPAGILLYGRDLNSIDGLNKLANLIVIPGNGNPIASMESLLAAVDAAGQRAHRRIPIVIDGLNEAEDPRNWKRLLPGLRELLFQFPYVLVVCTLRTGSRQPSENALWNNRFPVETIQTTFVEQALPKDVECIMIPDFGADTSDAVRQYFNYFRINPLDAELPNELLRHPLTLRLFCEVTNPTRVKEVGIEAIPGSLTSLFSIYLNQCAHRIAELSSIHHRYYEQDIIVVFDKLGNFLWDKNSREVDEKEFRLFIDDNLNLWDQSIVRALEQEGVILRLPGNTSGSHNIMTIYDALAGYLIANSILKKIGRDNLKSWLKDPGTVEKLLSLSDNSHPLSRDIFQELVGLFPQQNSKQLWCYLDEPLRSLALTSACKLESKYLDKETVDKISELILSPSADKNYIFNRLFHTRSSPSHPLNSKFLDETLRLMTMPNRDKTWTEWIRQKKKMLIDDIDGLEKEWRSTSDRSTLDILRAKWIVWMLTSTVRVLRDKATRALYWFGRDASNIIFDMAIKSLSINDPYVPERMLAVSYGVAMALHGALSNQDFKNKFLPEYVKQLYQYMFAKNALYSTTHALMRDYARHTIIIYLLHKPDLLNPAQLKRINAKYVDDKRKEWGRYKGFDEVQELGYGEPLHMDFANYTLGRLIKDRLNYTFDIPPYKEVLENIYWRISQLGYSPEEFNDIDKEISSLNWENRSDENEGRVDRYGKKYSWIAYFELYGLRYSKGLLKSHDSDIERPADIDIDPSFPEEPSNMKIINKDLLGNRKLSIMKWIEYAHRPSIKSYFIMNNLFDSKAQWILLDGFITQEDKIIGRKFLYFLRGLFIKRTDSLKFHKLLKKSKLKNIEVPDIPNEFYTFAGEIPWCDTFKYNGWQELEINTEKRLKKKFRWENQYFKNGQKLDSVEAKTLFENLRSLMYEKNKAAIKTILDSENITVKKVKIFSEEKIFSVVKLKVLLPVTGNNWESYHSSIISSRNISVPSREIAERSKISLKPPAWNMHDENNEIASISIKYGSPWNSGSNLCYLRKDIFDKFIKEKNLEFIWICTGIREIEWEFYKKEVKDYSTSSRRDFNEIYYYRNGKIYDK